MDDEPFIWNDKPCVWTDDRHTICVNSIKRASYVTLWTADNRKVGGLTVSGEYPRGYVRVGAIEIAASARGNGYATRMYRALLDFLEPGMAGISSHVPDQTNRRRIPHIWRKLGAFHPRDNPDWLAVARPEPEPAVSLRCWLKIAIHKLDTSHAGRQSS